MKVGLSGVSGIGKSSIARIWEVYFRSEGWNTILIEEVARGPELTDLQQRLVAVNIVAEEAAAMAKDPRLIICDRTIYDAYMYTVLFMKRGKINQRTFDFVSNFKSWWGGTYDIIFHIRRPMDEIMHGRSQSETLEDSRMIENYFLCENIPQRVLVDFKADIFKMAQGIADGVEKYEGSTK